MATRTRHDGKRGKPAPAKTTHTPPAQQHAATPDPVRQQQALDNQGSQGRFAPRWHARAEDDEDEDERPPTLH